MQRLVAWRNTLELINPSQSNNADAIDRNEEGMIRYKLA